MRNTKNMVFYTNCVLLTLMMDKKQILSNIQKHYNFTKDVDFARFLGISSQTLTNWRARNTFDYDIIYTKCVGISGDFILGADVAMFPENDVNHQKVEITPEFLLKRYEELVVENARLKELIDNKKSGVPYVSENEQTLMAAEPQTKLK